MMKAYIFPGQGAQFPGMGKDLYESCAAAKDLFEQANDILGFRITDIMFDGSEEDLVQTKVTQPSIYLYSVILSKVKEDLLYTVSANATRGKKFPFCSASLTLYPSWDII